MGFEFTARLLESMRCCRLVVESYRRGGGGESCAGKRMKKAPYVFNHLVEAERQFKESVGAGVCSLQFEISPEKSGNSPAQ